MAENYHEVSELFDLGFIHGGPNLAFCLRCGHLVELDEPEEPLAWLRAALHRILWCTCIWSGLEWI
jgi:hypothetical protein